MTGGDSVSPEMDGNRRAHHNALERKRRDHIKDSFTTLKEKLPMLEGERVSKQHQTDALFLSDDL